MFGVRGGAFGTVSFVKKINFHEIPSEIDRIAKAIDGLIDIELRKDNVDLSVDEERIIRIFARKFDCVACSVSSLGGGLSGAKVIRVEVCDDNGAAVHCAVAKIATIQDVRDEAERFDQYVVRLRPKDTPRKLALIEFGGGKKAGVFYGLADGCEQSLFGLLPSDYIGVAGLVESIRETLSPWVSQFPESRMEVEQVRKRLVDDTTYRSLIEQYGLHEMELCGQKKVQVRWVCVHGDLHGENALVAKDGSVVLIDYGDVGLGPASLDPITLELSVLFHPSVSKLNSSWPTLDQAELWHDLSFYLENCPYEDYVRACRDCAYDAAAGHRELAVVAYSYLFKQLKYEDANKSLIISLLKGVYRLYHDT